MIEPLLIDEDYYARVEGREIISNLAKAAGLATMISTMRPDIDNIDEYVRNTTARAFAVVASALGKSIIIFDKYHIIWPAQYKKCNFHSLSVCFLVTLI